MSYFERAVVLANVICFMAAAGFGWHLGAALVRDGLTLIDLTWQWLSRPRRAGSTHITMRGCTLTPSTEKAR